MSLKGSLYPDLRTSTVQAHAPSLSHIFQWGERHPPTGNFLGGKITLLTAPAALTLMGGAFSFTLSSAITAGITAAFLAGIPLLAVILLHMTSSSSVTGASAGTPPCPPGGLRVLLSLVLRAAT